MSLAVSASPLFVGNVVLGLVLLGLAVAGLIPRSVRGGLLLALVPLADAAALVGFVFGEDEYRGGGISRWHAYRSPGGALEDLFFASLVVLVGCAAALVVLACAGRPRPYRLTLAASGLAALFLVVPTVVGFNSN